MNSLQNEIDDFERLQRFSIPAKRIMEKIKPLKSNVDIARRRWFWELLQNASDYNDSVDIELELNRNFIKFRHNGNPFTYKDARNLVEPDSGKDEITDISQREMIGQFGTGFLATHILSLWIKVSGVIESQGQFINFNFDLDRRGKEHKNELMTSIESSLRQLNEAKSRPSDLNYIKNSKCDTEFLYDFAYPYDDENGFEIAKYGVENLSHVLPYVLSFIPKVKSITIFDNSNIQPDVYTFRGDELVEVEGQKIYFVKKTNQFGVVIQQNYILLVRHNETSVAVPIKPIGDTGKYEILDSHPEVPKLFCVFPMVGTETFNFPIVINSRQFEPKTERNGIELSDKDLINRARISEAVEAYKRLLGLAVRNNWHNLYRLCDIKEPNGFFEPIKTWYRNQVVHNVREAFLHQQVVETVAGRITLNNAYIPYHADKVPNVKKIYELAAPLLSDKLPQSNHFLNWYEILDFQHFKNQKFDLERLLDEVQLQGHLDNLAEKVNADFKPWLNGLIDFVLTPEQEHLFERYKILPNQNKNFKFRRELDFDDQVPNDLKDLLLALTNDKKDYKDFLLHKDYANHFGLLDPKNRKSISEIATDIDNELRDFSEVRTSPSFLNAINALFKWISDEIGNHNLSDDKAKILFPWFAFNKAQIVLDTFSNDTDRENAFIIVQSGKMETLAKIAQSDISNKDLQLLAENVDEFKAFLAWKNNPSNTGYLTDVVDDSTFADEQTGQEGERFVYAILVAKFGEQNVEWSSQQGEHQYDFKVFNTDRSPRYFIDVKTTKRGMANSDSIPFFMRYSQWNFLDRTESLDKYFLARVFTEAGTFKVKFLKINKTEI
jgi:hypothetical protein